MELSVRRSDLAKELQLVQGIVERKNSIPILSNVLVEARGGELRISATDLDVSVLCGCAAQVAREGGVTLSAKKLYEIVRSLPEADLSLKLEKDAWVRIRCERSDFRMAGLPREDFPTLPTARAGRTVEIPVATLRGLVQRTAFAITAEDARYYLAGALLLLEAGAIAMVATDGHRLAWVQQKLQLGISEPQRVLVPRKAINELGRLMDELGPDEKVGFQAAESHLIFTAGGRTLASKTVEAQFPAFEKVVTVSGDKKLEIDREMLLAAIRRVSLLSSERGRAVKLGLQSAQLEVSASSPELGEARESLAVEYEGDGAEIGFNAQYLIDFLLAVGSQQVKIEVRDAESQGIFLPVGDDSSEYRYVVMPMRF